MISKKNLLIILVLIAVAVAWRLVNHAYGLAYNLELVTASSVIAALWLGWKAGLIVPVATMAISDAIIGNSGILLLTWVCFAAIGLTAVVLRKLNNRPSLQALSSAGFALLASTLFYLVTNAGVWLQGYYPPGLGGLMMSLAMGLPFYKNMLIGNLIILPTVITAWQLHQAHVHATKNQLALN